MSQDNSPKIRQRRQLERKQNRRDSYDRILIVCEGKKTEPQYFEEIRQYYRLNTANVKVLPSDYGTTPQQVVDFACDQCLKNKQWEHVYCVFDRDNHPKSNFDNALKSAKATDKKYKNDLKQFIRFTAIQSNPNFELWLLLHFDCITREISSKAAIAELKKHLHDYNKGQSGYFNKTQDKLNIAFDHAKRLSAQRKQHGNENPYTAMDELVRRLMDLKP